MIYKGTQTITACHSPLCFTPHGNLFQWERLGIYVNFVICRLFDSSSVWYVSLMKRVFNTTYEKQFMKICYDYIHTIRNLRPENLASKLSWVVEKRE